MDARIVPNLILKLTIWFLLTADFSFPNILIGLAIALLLPSSKTYSGTIKEWLRVLGKIVLAIPQAYLEAIEIMFKPHQREDFICERVNPKRSPALVFLDIFLITFTPKTIVTKYDELNGYEIHRVRRETERMRD